VSSILTEYLLIKGSSAYILPWAQQVALCVPRGFLRIRNNISVPIGTIVGNCIISIVMGSMFYNMPEDTSSFFGRGALLFFTSLINTTLAAFEVSHLGLRIL
jgi:ATP-binding cassette subfamily G (WHITE) protein 2 (PDR)